MTLRLTRVLSAIVDQQKDLTAGVHVMPHRKNIAHHDGDPQLFEQLARERLLWGLPGLDLPAGKLPRARQMPLIEPPTDQIPLCVCTIDRAADQTRRDNQPAHR